MRGKLMAICLVLAVVAALVYVLMAVGVLTAGDIVTSEGLPPGFYVVPAGYVLCGALVLLKKRRLWITGAAINGFAIVMFYAMYAGKPEIMLSAPGLMTKIAQVILEAGLIYLIVTFQRLPAAEAT